MPVDDQPSLATENAELRRRIALAEAEIAELRRDAIARRAEIRAIAEALPAEMSRHALVRKMLHDVRHHPDPGDVVRRAVRKLGRAPRKAWKLARGRS